MATGEITILEIVLTAFSGSGIIFLSWIFRRKVFRFFKSNDKHKRVIQQNNEVKGDMAGGNITKAADYEKFETKQKDTTIIQSENIVDGDMAGGNIVKREE